MNNVNKPVYDDVVEVSSMKVSDVFRNFAKMLDDEKRSTIINRDDRDRQELLEIISRLKRYAWSKMGGVVITDLDQSMPVEDWQKGTEYESRSI